MQRLLFVVVLAVILIGSPLFADCLETMSSILEDGERSQASGDPCANSGVPDMGEPDLTDDPDGSPLTNALILDTSSLASLPGWYWCASYDNYAPGGMPDFDQRQQEGWSGICGPTAVANCFWWLDSRYADRTGLPGDGNDSFPLVRDYGGSSAAVPGSDSDDHSLSNVNHPVTPWPPAGPPPQTSTFVPGPQLQPPGIPAWGELVERLVWYTDCNRISSGRVGSGTNSFYISEGITQWLEEEGLVHMLNVTSVRYPDFYFIGEAVEHGDCVILEIGWWEEETPGVWSRPGGHYVTAAGVNSDEMLIAISDPSFDQIPPDDRQHHNDAAIVSHDIWHVELDSPRSGNKWGLPDYAEARFAEKYPDRSIYGLVDVAVIISSIPPSVNTRPASTIGADSASLNMTYTLGDQTTVDIRFAYRMIGDSNWTDTSWAAQSNPWVYLAEEGIYIETLTGLHSNSDYEFKAELRYNEIAVEGDVLTFSTEKMGPTVTTEGATDIGTDSATLNMSFNVGDYSPVEVRFNWREYGTDLWTETVWTSRESGGTHVEALNGLHPNTVYELRTQLTYDDSPLMVEGDILTFTTGAEGWCFIATATYGTSMARETQILREFRDKYLLTNILGQGFTEIYYGISPPIADFITDHPSLKPIVRAGLTPVVLMCSMVFWIAPGG